MEPERSLRSQLLQWLTSLGAVTRVASRAVLVGQDLSTADGIIDLTDTPVAPETVKTLSANEVNITYNDAEGNPISDTSELWQQSNWKEFLFNGQDSGEMAEFTLGYAE